MLDDLQGKDKALCDGREGLKSLELLIAAYRSARDRQNVNLPLEL
jgi:UDP-N-acetyl-2-amino-2-deoxyglucuronate dehydrogenase